MEKINELFKSRYCSRKDYWIFFGITFITYFIFVYILEILTDFSYDDYKVDLLLRCSYLLFFIPNLVLQIKRLQDANINPYWLLIYLITGLGIDVFNNIVYIIIFILLILPSQRITTSKLYKEEE